MSLGLCLESPLSSVDFTYANTSTGVTSTLDHFIVSRNVYDGISCYVSVHEGDNLSDHYPVLLELQIDVEYSKCNTQPSPRPSPSWRRADQQHIECYREHFRNELQRVEAPAEALVCRQFNCTEHLDDLKGYYSAILTALTSSANACIPERRKKAMAGWSEHVGHRKDDAIFWHSVWVSGGRVRGNWLHAIMLRTRAEYKRVSRWVVRNQESLVAGRMADAFRENRSRDLWSEIKRVKGSGCRQSTVIDGAVGSQDSCHAFHEVYKSLYQSVPTSDCELDALSEELSASVLDQCQGGECYSSHSISPCDVAKAMGKLKPGKSDAVPGLYSDHFINACHELYIHLALFLNSMLFHFDVGAVMSQSILVPIPKDRKKSMNVSSNYRSIAISSIVGKCLDNVILSQHAPVLSTTHLQF
jgi:hypothetical protein